MEELVSVSRVQLGETIWEITASDRGVMSVRPQTTFLRGAENRFSQLAAKQLEEYWSGNRTEFDLPFDLKGTAFQRSVWAALQEIPYGKTCSYSQLTERLGRPSAVRAVANAIGKNPCLILIPCHRVLGKNGSLTGFSGGLELKKQLLNLEAN